MAFVLRRPFTVSVAVRQIPKSSNLAIRFIHKGPFRPSTSPKTPTGFLPSSFTKARQSFQDAFRRSYIPSSSEISQGSGNLTQKLIYGAAIVGGTIVVTNLVFNRETREDGGMPPYERRYLNETFLHTGLGVGIIGIAARALHTSGWSYRLMATNPWAVIGLSLVASIGTMYATFYTPPEK